MESLRSFLLIKGNNKGKVLRMWFKRARLHSTWSPKVVSIILVLLSLKSWKIQKWVKGLWNLPLRLRGAAKARHVAAESLHGSPEAVEVKPGMHWWPLNVGDARARDTGQQQLLTRNGMAQEKCAAAGKARRTELCEPFDVRHGSTGQLT